MLPFFEDAIRVFTYWLYVVIVAATFEMVTGSGDTDCAWGHCFLGVESAYCVGVNLALSWFSNAQITYPVILHCTACIVATDGEVAIR